jgi:serine/threonine protein kinase
VTLTDKYDSTVIAHLVTLSDRSARKKFIAEAKVALTTYLDEMHKCDIVHRDVHQGNFLYRHKEPHFALTDFDDALAASLGTSERQIESYSFSDDRAAADLVVELEELNDYMSGRQPKLNLSIFEDYVDVDNL